MTFRGTSYDEVVMAAGTYDVPMPRTLEHVPLTGHDTHLRGPHLRVPDERPRLRAALRAAGGRRLRQAAPADEQADVVVFNTCAVRENADNRLYGNLGHLAPVKAQAARHADRRRRLPGAEGPRHDHHEGALGRRRLRHPQHRLAAGAARARPGRRRRRRSRSSSRSRSSPSTLPTKRESAYAAWVSVSVGCNNTCTFCIVPSAARQGEGPPTGRRARRDPGAGRRGRQRGDAAGPERQLLRRRVRRPARLRQAAACLRRDRRAGAGAVHQPAPRRRSPTTSSPRWPRRPT